MVETATKTRSVHKIKWGKIHVPHPVFSQSKQTKVYYFLKNLKARNNVFLSQLNKM